MSDLPDMSGVVISGDKPRSYHIFRSIFFSILAAGWFFGAFLSVTLHKPLGIAVSLFLGISFGAVAIQQAKKSRLSEFAACYRLLPDTEIPEHHVKDFLHVDATRQPAQGARAKPQVFRRQFRKWGG